MSERAEASEENSQLIFSVNNAKWITWYEFYTIVDFEFSANCTRSRQLPVAYTVSELRKTNV